VRPVVPPAVRELFCNAVGDVYRASYDGGMSQRIEFSVRLTNVAEQARKMTVCEAVIGRFAGKTHAGTAICLIDSEDCVKLKQCIGLVNRGLHKQLDRDDQYWIPEFFHHVVWPTDGESFDSVIYVHGSTAGDDIGLTLTLAHELQHFVQTANDEAMMRVNDEIKQFATAWSDIPIERDARIVAKRVAEEIYGDEDVKQYLEKRVKDHFDDANDWQFVSSIDTSRPYDVSVESKSMAHKFGLNYSVETE
jgi:hypothetical protein